MSKILRYTEYKQSEEKANEFIEMVCNPQMNESKDSGEFESIAKRLSKDLKFNFGLIATFGTGIKMMIPVVQNLIEKGTFNFEMTQENLILLTITVVAITYLEETANKAGDEVNAEGEKSIVTKKDAQTMLEELKMRGIGQGIIRKFVSALSSVGKFFKMLFRGTPYVINGLLDMFGYTALLLPCMNALSDFIGKYDITIENIAANLLSLGVGMGALLAKQGVVWLVDKLKKSLNLKDFGKDLDKPIEMKPFDIVDGETDNLDKSKLIKEQ
jgi:hypothetical protein